MKRDIYDDDHEAFRLRQGVPRPPVVPHFQSHADSHGLPREFWIEAGKQGFLDLEVPEQYGGQLEEGARDYRFNAVLTEELAGVNMTLPSCVGIVAPTSWRRTSCTPPPTSRSSAGCRSHAPRSGPAPTRTWRC